MSTEDLTLDVLAYHSFPHLASAVRAGKDAIIHAWEDAVRQALPAADRLTLQQLRNTLPSVLDEIAEAFASNKPRTIQELIEGSKRHGATRFHENYCVRELIVEYMLLRRIVIEHVSEALGKGMDTNSSIALNIAIDVVLQSGIVTFTDHLQRQIRASAEIQSKYLSFLSHDLRNHLNNAVLQLQLLSARLARAPEHAETVESIQSIKQGVLRTTVGMDRLLQAEQLRHEAVDLNLYTVDLAQLLSEVAQQWRSEAQSKGFNLNVEVPDGARIESDETLLTLVLQNLLGNAVKYSSSGTVKLLAQPRLTGNSAAWMLCVSDQGPGIPSENRTKLFDAFKRGDMFGQPGVGLGLAIALHATRLLGGQLEVESALGSGSTFRLILPTCNPSCS